MKPGRLSAIVSPEAIASILVAVIAVGFMANQVFAGPARTPGSEASPEPSSSVSESAQPTFPPLIRSSLSTLLVVNQRLAQHADTLAKTIAVRAPAADDIAAILRSINTELEIGNQAANFCVGANLMLLLVAIQEGEWDDVHQAVRAFQSANIALKYAPKPVVAAPFGLTLGGGVEICLHSARVRAAAETYMGLVEVGVGLIPAAGGTKEMLVRAMDAAPRDEGADPFALVKEVFQNIGMARVSTSAEEARRLGYLSARDSISMNRDRLIADAKQLALDLVKLGFRPGKPRDDIQVLGQSAFAKMKLGLHLMRRAEYISDYDVVVGTHLAKVLSGGGEFTSPQRVSEQYLLDLEREAFVSLCGQRKTVERIQHMLKKGKPLRN